MPYVPADEERFSEYLKRPERPGLLVHSPYAEEAFFKAFPRPYQNAIDCYIITLPYRWADAQRIREVAIWIARLELQIWNRSALDRLVHPHETQREDLTALEIADRLIAPRPWVEDMVRQFGSHRSALEQMARSISIPVASVRTMLNAPASPIADSIHQRIRAATGYPWFLPKKLRNRYSIARW